MTIVVIEGVADMPSGAGASLEEGSWCGVMLLRPWREAEGAVRRDFLRVLLPPSVTSGLAMRAVGRVQHGAAYRIDVELVPRSEGMSQSARLQGRLKRIEPNSELAQVDASMNSVVRIRDPRLGRLERGPKRTSFVGRLRVQGRLCALTIWEREGDSPEVTIENASGVIGRLEPALAELPSTVAAKMLETANEWRSDIGRSRLTAEQFQRRLRLISLYVNADGKVLVQYSCGDILGDHGIDANVDESGNLVSVDLG